VGEVHGQVSALLDTRRRIADDVIEGFAQLIENAFHSLQSQRVLVPGLGRRQDVEVVRALVLDQRLNEVRVAVDQVDEVVHHTTLAAHDQVEVTQPYIEVDDDRLVSTQIEPGTDGSAGSGFANAPLACGND